MTRLSNAVYEISRSAFSSRGFRMPVLGLEPGSRGVMHHLASLLNRQIPGGSESANQVWEPLRSRYSPRHDIQGAGDTKLGPALRPQGGQSEFGKDLGSICVGQASVVSKTLGPQPLFKPLNL